MSTIIRNARARYDLANIQTIGPRQCLIVSLLASVRTPLLASEVVETFKLKATTNSMRASLKRMADKGYIRIDLSTAIPTKDGFFSGERYTVTAKGRALAKRMQRIEGLGTTFAVVKGHR